MSEKIFVKINEPSKIFVKINNDNKIKVNFGNQGLMGPQGPTGPAGTTDHRLLTNLDYVNSGHSGFQKELIYSPEYKAYEIE